MKTIISLMFLLLCAAGFSQSGGYEKTFTYSITSSSPVCIDLDDLNQTTTRKSAALQVEWANITDGYVKLFGKSTGATNYVWMRTGNADYDSINVATYNGKGLTSGGWLWEVPIFDMWKVCWYKKTDTSGTLTIHQLVTERK